MKTQNVIEWKLWPLTEIWEVEGFPAYGGHCALVGKDGSQTLESDGVVVGVVSGVFVGVVVVLLSIVLVWVLLLVLWLVLLLVL